MENWKPYGPWKIKSTATAYKDAFVDVRLDQVIRPDQKDGQHVVVEMKPGVCVLAMDQEDGETFVYLTDEFHYGIGQHSIEAVSGGIELGEDPDETARRELEEELGLVAETWEYLFSVNPFTTIIVSPTRVYFAKGLTRVDTNLEGTEQIEMVRMPLREAIADVRAGKITHTPTCIAIYEAALRIATE